MKKYLLTATAVLIVLLDLSVLTTVSASKEYLSVDGVNTNLETSNLSEATKALTEEDKVEFIGLSDAEIDSKEIDISESYNEGDILSEEDTIFLLNLINEQQNRDDGLVSIMAGKSQQSVSTSTTKFGTKVTMTGTMYQDIAAFVGTSTFRGRINLTRNSGSLSKVALRTHHSSYGLVGWNGKYPSIGLVYKGSVGMSKTTSLGVTQMDKDAKYNSIASSYTTMYTQATITTSKGDQYTLTTGTWKKFH